MYSNCQYYDEAAENHKSRNKGENWPSLPPDMHMYMCVLFYSSAFRYSVALKVTRNTRLD